MKTVTARLLCRLLIVLMAWTPFHIAQAAMIGTDQVVASSVQSERAALLNLMTRPDIAKQLQMFGLDAATAKDRVAAMTDEEVRTLAGQIEALPAGASNAGAALVVLVLIVLLVWWLATKK